MAITPNELNLTKIFSDTKYYVDFYQREYKWNDSKQEYKPISSLLEDIFFRFELDYKANDPVNQETIDNYRFYYLNSFMINKVAGKTYIVDGQQRLTTLTIISIMLCKLAEEFGANDGLISFIRQRICSNDALGNYIYWMGFDDRRVALDNLMKNAVEDIANIDRTNATISQKNIYEAAPIIYNMLKSRITDSHKFMLFQLYYYNRITMVQLDVIDAKDVAMTFEVINDRGVPLRAYEILKGKLVGSLDKADQTAYADKWDECVGSLMDIDGKDETDDFFAWYFQSKFATNYTEHKALGKQYHKSIFVEPFTDRIGFKDKKDRTHISKIKRFIDQDLKFFSDLYIRMHKNKKDENLGIYFWFCVTNGQNTSIHNLMLSAISYNDPLLNEKYEAVSKEFDRLYTILMLTNSYESSAFISQMAELAIKIRNAPTIDVIKESFLDTIKSIIKDERNKDSVDDIFAPGLYERATYTSLGKGFLRYFFGRIDHYLSDEMQLPTVTYHGLIKQTSGGTVYHIEHILSRNEENLSWFENEDEFEDYRNRLGALTFLKGLDNQSSGNESYKDKLTTYMNTGTIWAKTLCPQYSHSNIGLQNFCSRKNITFKQYDKYDAIAVKERTAILMQLIKMIWG
ncbi:MAG: DUF262 domain-containing HNH endonuclease family protein [Clostridia bacterium]|nr:DUF262 domain-containing HNH endonuclease family protein [Clostridia bacterium]